MGDQIGTAVGGTLYYVPLSEFDRVLSMPGSPVSKASMFAALCRINVLYMIARAGSGHIGSSFSSMEIMSWIQLNELQKGSSETDLEEVKDIFFSSKGHDAPALYSTLAGIGKLDFELIHRLRKIDGLPGHPDVSTPNIVTNTGSLGMGISKAKGMITANRLKGRSCRVLVLTGDGELQEGQFWESLVSAVNRHMGELTVIIDHNKLQSDTLVTKVSDLGDLEAKFTAFGWHVSRCDGHDLEALSSVFDAVNQVFDRPKVIIADTIKGKGVSFMEHTSIDSDVEFYKFHSGAPDSDSYKRAVQELINRANDLLEDAGVSLVTLEQTDRPEAQMQSGMQRLIPAYSEALLKQARIHPEIVALDADLILDTGLIPFQKEFPDRFIECGIAEQDMVSQAGGMALQGLWPVVHSFSCFLSARPNEQIYNNATERTKIIYVGSLAGVVPGGPGHSHQAVRDISSLSAIPGLTIVEPSCEAEVGMLLDWAVNQNQLSTYLRLVSIPWSVSFELPAGYIPERGKGVALTEGDDAVVFAYGPVTLSNAVLSAALLRERFGVGVKVVNMPWLNELDIEWFMDMIVGCEILFSLENHFMNGGQSDMLSKNLIERGKNIKMKSIGIDDIPKGGTVQEVMEEYGLNSEKIVDTIISFLK